MRLHGLFDHEKYKQALEPFSGDQRNLFNMTTSLFANEILGRSRSNFVDVTAPLVMTAVQGGKLSDNLLSCGLFTPNKNDDPRNVGGAELSKIGRVGSALTLAGLSSKNRELVDKNQAMFGSLLETTGSTAELDKAIRGAERAIRQQRLQFHVRLQVLITLQRRGRSSGVFGSYDSGWRLGPVCWPGSVRA